MLLRPKKPLDDDKREKAAYLYDKYKSILISVAMKILKDAHMAEDVVHTTFEAILKNLDAIEDCKSARTANYLIITTKHFAFKEYNRQKNNQHVFEDVDGDIDILKPADGFDPVWDQVKLHISRREISEALQQIDATNRFLLISKYYFNLDYKEIAAITKTSENAVATRIFRAKKKLAEIFVKRSGGETQ